MWSVVCVLLSMSYGLCAGARSSQLFNCKYVGHSTVHSLALHRPFSNSSTMSLLYPPRLLLHTDLLLEGSANHRERRRQGDCRQQRENGDLRPRSFLLCIKGAARKGEDWGLGLFSAMSPPNSHRSGERTDQTLTLDM